jgi:hypothetical protein
MKTILRLLGGVTVAASMLPTAAAQKVSYDYNRTADFTRFKTYTFKDCTKTDSPLIDARITTAVAAELGARGFIRDDREPDMYVTARQAFRTEKEYTAYTTGYGYPWGWGTGWGWGWHPGWDWGWNPSWYTDVRVRDIVVGTLTIDLTDAATEQLLWRGVGVKDVHASSSPSRIDKRVTRAVAKIFKSFSPARAEVATDHELR